MKGSKYAIIKLVESSKFSSIMNELIENTGANLTIFDNWMPKSLQHDKEAELKDFLKYNFSSELGENIHDWWLEVKHPMSRTPNWDLVSTCTIDGKKGLILVEAKAHVDELHIEGKSLDVNASEDSKKNHNHIEKTIEDANNHINEAINPVTISISSGSCYQLSNRIAHAWWLANQGIPVVLIYLGILNCQDMNDGKRKLFKSDEEWQSCFEKHARIIGVNQIIGERVVCDNDKFITICKSLNSESL